MCGGFWGEPEELVRRVVLMVEVCGGGEEAEVCGGGEETEEVPRFPWRIEDTDEGR